MTGKLWKLYDNIEYGSLIVALAVMVAVIFAQVVMRYVFNNSLSWSEEFARYLFVWFSWLGVSAGVKDKEHLKVEMLSDALTKRGFLKAKEVMNIIVTLVWLATTLIVAYYGIQVVQIQMTLNVVTPAMRLPVWIGYFAIPFCSFVVGIRLLGRLCDSLRALLNNENNRKPVYENEVQQ